MTGAFPKQFDELIEQAQRLARELGTMPSQNKLKAALHVRSERARAVLHALRDAGFDPSEPATDTPAPRRLHLVPADSGERADKPATADAAEFATISGTLPPDTGMAVPPPVPAGDSGQVPEQVSDTGEPVPAVPRWSWPAWSRNLSVSPSGTASEEPVPAGRPVRPWPVLLLAAPAFVAIWSGWVGLGTLTGFGMVHPLPGIADGFTINSAITLPIGVETYAAYALRVWLAAGIGTDDRARRFAKWSAIGALLLGACGQIAYHLMVAARVTSAPWEITTAVSCLPVIVLGLGAALAHLQHSDRTEVGR